MQPLIMNEAEIRAAITMKEAIAAMEHAFVAYSRKAATVPPIVSLEVPEYQGEVHIKAAHMHATPEFVIKVACGFWENRNRNLPIGSGLMLVFSAETGFPQGVLLDNGYLTELRTGAAGAVAAKYMAREDIKQVAIIGAGSQGRFQLQALSIVRQFQRVFVYDHHPQNIEKYIADMRPGMSAEIQAAKSLEEAVAGSDVIITATPARKPVLFADWIRAGTHITALGSDGPDKQELDTGVLARADRIIADSIVQCAQFGEIHHALERGVLVLEEIDGELGDVISGRVRGRENADEITICDLTGIGVQDAAIASLVYHKTVHQTSNIPQHGAG